MPKYTYATRLSEHLAETPEGYLLCTSCVLCRSGTQQYRKSELDTKSSDDSLVNVFRPPEEVTSPRFLGSIAGKGVTLNHPGSGFLSAMTHAWSAKGTVLNARVGPEDENGNVTVIGDIVITDPAAIDQVKAGLRQLSLGYNYKLIESEHGFEMRGLICNHVAIVESGRAGNAQIVDGPPPPVESYEQTMKRYHRVDALTVEPAPTPRQALDNSGDLSPMLATLASGEDEDEDRISMAKTKDEQSQMSRLCDLLEKFLARMDKSSAEDFSTAEPGDNREKPDHLGTELIPDDDQQHGEGINPTVEDARRALDGLRQLRSIVEASGDLAAIHDYNDAVKRLKRTIATGRTFPADRTSFNPAYDRGTAQGSFEAACKRRHRQPIKVDEQPRDEKHRAEDREPPNENYQQTVDRARRKMLSEQR